MNWRLIFSRNTRHLRILAFLMIASSAGAMFVRSQMVPMDYGQRGPYRAAALAEIASHPSALQSDITCLKCHTDVEKERSEAPHAAVRCFHCHGNGRQHTADAEKAAEFPEHQIPPAKEWDGDFRTHTDLFITHDRATCLSCHTSVVGMPDAFRSINVADHLDEQGAEEITSGNVCFECHEGHSPGLQVFAGENMTFELNILNNGGECCGSGDSTEKQYGHHTACGGYGEAANDSSRRQFLNKASTIAFGSFSLTLLPMSTDVPSIESGSTDSEKLSADTGSDAKDTVEDALYGFLVDTEKCVGTGKCLTACREENDVPEVYSRTWVARFVHYKDGTVQVDLVPETGFAESDVTPISPRTCGPGLLRAKAVQSV